MFKVMSDSIFTKIIKGEMPAAKVYEDEAVMVIMDRFPSIKGQAVVFPKEQIDYIFDVPDALYTHLWLITKKIARAMDSALTPARVCVVVEGFDVPHVHIRVYPVALGEPLGIKSGSEAPDVELEEYAKKIQGAL